MTLNLSTDINGEQSGPEESSYVTVAGLFEDVIDARHLLAALRKSGCPADGVSLIVRDLRADEGGPAERHGAVARAVEEADLNGHSGWLLGLASLIVPQRGTFLVAGMLGAMLAGVTLDDDDGRPPESALVMTLNDFGFDPDESTYIESRILAGTMLVAVTTRDEGLLATSRSLLADDNAVHIGAVRTAEEVASAATDLLDSPPEIYGTSDVVVTDVVAPLQPLVAGKRGIAWARAMKGRQVIDRDGAVSGRIENLIAEPADDTLLSQEHVRYVVVSFGGVLGVGRRSTAIPVEHVTLSDGPIQVSVTRDVLKQAPAYDAGAPFSRREEQVVCAYFGCSPYWVE